MSDSVSTEQSGVLAIEREVQIIVFTLLVNLGFFKLDEIPSFVEGVNAMLQGQSLLSVILISGAFILYMVYIGSILYGLYCWLKGIGSVERAMVISLGSFFAYYILILIYNLNLHTVG